ncbi:MAG: EcoRV family type II restriction endonuclease [Propionibacteriaceae bacterium]|nr:EcoRV family type II restriction endonuclease [Propionibacteriaceae bacterium]
MAIEHSRETFETALRRFVESLASHTEQPNGQWTVKGFIDAFRNVYTISSDTKIVSKILEIHIFPLMLKFASDNRYKLVLATHQNYYPDISFVSEQDETLRFAVDFKTTYRIRGREQFCNGFTLGSHGTYFVDRTSTKNIQFPYASYAAHYSLGIIYDRASEATIDETAVYGIEQLESITSVISNLQFFVAEKWRIASDKGGSGNTANIGSINYIPDIIAGRGMFSTLGEEWFDDYWMNFGRITVVQPDGETKVVRDLPSFVTYRGGDLSLIRKRYTFKGGSGE